MLFVILLLCAIAIAPLLRGQAPCTHDGALHYYRVVAMRHALQDGVLFTRYLPDLAFGYGYPFFNYREPLSYYLLLALYLVGLPLPLASNLVYVLSIVASALAAYLLARDLWGSRAGLVAAVAYAYAPYQFLDANLRANMPESVALALLPLILWAFRRLALAGQRMPRMNSRPDTGNTLKRVRQQQRRWFLASTVALAALYLTHNISSLLFTPFLLAYLAVLGLVGEKPCSARNDKRAGINWLAVCGAFALACGLTAFFWGPALLEQEYVQLHMSRVTRNNDFHYNFVSLAEVLAPPAAVDTSLENPPMRVPLGLATVIVGGIGLVCGLRRWRDAERRATLVFLALATVVMVWMSTRASLWLWEHVPLLPFVQFPWRLIGRATLPLAILTAAIAAPHAPRITNHETRITDHESRITKDTKSREKHEIPNTKHETRNMHYALHVAYHVIIAALILSAFPSTYPPYGYCPSAASPTIQDVFAYEHRSGLVGVDPEGSYFPAWVKRRPAGSSLEEEYTAGGPVTRFDETALPVGGTVLEARYGPNRARVVVEAPSPFRARYLAFYFPGWRAWVDGEPVTVAPTDPEGLITFDVPAGRHTVTVRFGSTPTRSAFTAVSALSLAALCVMGLCELRCHQRRIWRSGQSRKGRIWRSGQSKKGRIWRSGQSKKGRIWRSGQSGIWRSGGSSAPDPKCQGLPPIPGHRSLSTDHWSLIAVAIVLITLKLAIVDRADTPFRRPTLQPDGTLPGLEHRLDQAYVDGLTLMGYDQEGATMPADGTLRLDLYWTARSTPGGRYQSVIHLVGADGLRWSLPDTFRPRGYADYPPTTTWRPDRYALDSQEVEPLPGTPPGTYEIVLTVFDRDTLAPLSVLNEQGQPAAPDLALGQVRLTRPRRPVELPSSGRLDLPVGDLTLLSADFDRAEAAPGDTVHLSAWWRAERERDVDAGSIALALLNSDGSAVSTYRVSLAAEWQTGDVLLSQQRLMLPATLESGTYTWAVGLGPPPTPDLAIRREQRIQIARLSVVAPPRIFSPPPLQHPVGVTLGSLATLSGFDLGPASAAEGTVRPGSVLTVTLAWRAEGTAASSYHVFLHLLDPAGNLVAQSDGVPAGWSRPTTGWLPGETIADVRTLTIPPGASPGDYTIQAGLYIPGGARLVAPDGAHAIRLATVTVQGP